MKIKTSRFGEIEIEEDKIISMKNGLLGFENTQKYVLLSGSNSDFYWLQSAERPELAFACMLPHCVCDDYEALADEKVISDIELENDDDALVLCVVVIPDEIKKATVNLRAPIIINNVSKKGVQIVLDDNRYETRHPVFVQ